MQGRKKSEIIRDFLELVKESPSEYGRNYSEVHNMDLLKGDILHKFELKPVMTEEQRLLLDKKLVDCLQVRRKFKDQVELYDPIKDFLYNNSQVVSLITQLLNEVEGVEKYHETRKYTPKVMTEGEFNA